MAWRFNPDDFDQLATKSTAEVLTEEWRQPLGGVVVFRCFVLARGHIQDTEHHELGAPTFAEYGEEHVKIMEAERARFAETLEALKKYMAPMPRLTNYGMVYLPVPRFIIDPKAI